VEWCVPYLFAVRRFAPSRMSSFMLLVHPDVHISGWWSFGISRPQGTSYQGQILSATDPFARQLEPANLSPPTSARQLEPANLSPPQTCRPTFGRGLAANFFFSCRTYNHVPNERCKTLRSPVTGCRLKHGHTQGGKPVPCFIMGGVH
jgi:hypothetical protein